MKKALRITGIVLLSLLALVAVICGMASWILFSSSGLKKTAQMAIEAYSPCRIETGDINLSLIKTFPHAGLSIDDITVFNEPGFAPSDTMLHAGNITVQIDIDAFRNEGILKVRKLFITDADALLYKDAQGRSNLDVFSGDKPEKEPRSTFPDSLNTNLSFDLEQFNLNNINLCYSSIKDSTSATVSDLDARIDGRLSPALDGKAGMKLSIGDVVFSKDAGNTMSAILRNLSVNADIALDNPDANGTITINGGTAELSTAQLSAVLSAPEIAFNGKAGLKSQQIDGCLSISSGEISATSPTLLAKSEGMNLKLDAKGSYTLDNFISTVLDGAVRSVNISVSGQDISPMNASLGNIGISATADADIRSLNGSANLSLKTEALNFHNGSENPLNVASAPLQISLDGQSEHGIIHCISSIYSSSFELASGNEKYILRWPVSVNIDAECDTAFHRFNLKKGTIDINNQNVGLTGICSLDDNSMNASLKAEAGNLDIESLLAMLPARLQKSLEGIRASGHLSLNADGSVSRNNGLMAIRQGKANVKAIDFSGCINDSLSADADELTIVATYPVSGQSNCTADIEATGLEVNMVQNSILNLSASDANIHTVLNGFVGSPTVRTRKSINAVAELNGIAASFDTISATFNDLGIDGTFYLADGTDKANADARITIDGLEAIAGDNLGASLSYASIDASAELDTAKQTILQKWNPDLYVHMENTGINKLDVPLFVPNIDFGLSLGKIDIADSQISLGRSEFSLVGAINNIGDFLYENGHMDGSLDFKSGYADMDELMGLISGLGREGYAIESDNTPFADVDNSTSTTDYQKVAESKEPNPFIVPDRMHIVLNTNIEELDFNRHKFYNMGGGITVKDGSLVLQELGFSSDAAEMQLTAIYKTPRPDNLYMGLDFHLLDIRIDELIDLIPAVDSIVPMLKAFDGKAQFHLAAETNTDGYYMPKMPTLIGAAAIEGKDLVVMDNEVFNSIKKKLLMSKKAENRIDSLSVELQVLRNKVDLYPFIVSMDRYSAAIGGRHNINKALDCSYHISILKTPLPLRLGIDISGALWDIKAKPMRHIKLSKCKYDSTFIPQQMNATDARVLEMKNAISETLKSNVR